MDILTAITNNQLLPKQLKVCLSILALYNCRASEVLSANKKNFVPGHFLILKGKKKSSDIIIRDRLLLLDIASLVPSPDGRYFSCVSYPQLYRAVKAQYSHLFIPFKGKKNFKVTHGFRYAAASLSNDPASVKSILNHNSLKSGRFYNKHLPHKP